MTKKALLDLLSSPNIPRAEFKALVREFKNALWHDINAHTFVRNESGGISPYPPMLTMLASHKSDPGDLIEFLCTEFGSQMKLNNENEFGSTPYDCAHDMGNKKCMLALTTHWNMNRYAR